jgi:hypothetical protein
MAEVETPHEQQASATDTILRETERTRLFFITGIETSG